MHRSAGCLGIKATGVAGEIGRPHKGALPPRASSEHGNSGGFLGTELLTVWLQEGHGTAERPASLGPPATSRRDPLPRKKRKRRMGRGKIPAGKKQFFSLLMENVTTDHFLFPKWHKPLLWNTERLWTREQETTF